jgi:ATP phosphoribosyltransferase
VLEVLPSMRAPTISELSGGAGFALEAVVAKADINVLIPALSDHGATDILELPLSKIVH